jgi:hypothetical protein
LSRLRLHNRFHSWCLFIELVFRRGWLEVPRARLLGFVREANPGGRIHRLRRKLRRLRVLRLLYGLGLGRSINPVSPAAIEQLVYDERERLR